MGLKEVLDVGSIGFFWTCERGVPNFESTSERGYVKRKEGWTVLEVLDEDPLGSLSSTLGGSIDFPEMIVGIMPDEAALFLDVVGPLATHRFAGPRASSKRYMARTVVGGVPVHRVRSPLFRAVYAHFHGIGRWAGLSASQETWETEADGRVRGWSASLGGSDEQSHRVSGGRRLVISTTWTVAGPTDNRTISAPVSIGCESRTRVTIERLLQPILDTQDLLNFAFGGFVPANGGTARPDLEAPEEGRVESAPTLWNGALMIASPAVNERGSKELPLFDLQMLGDVAGLARWLRLVSDYPRATHPVVSRYRLGTTSASVVVLEIAAAMEYWVKVNRSARWAQTAFAQAVAGKAGTAFRSWVGNPASWATAFWETYNLLKHEPSYQPNPTELDDLAESGRYVLGAVLMDRAAGTRATSQSLFRHHRLGALGERLRNRYA